MLIGYLESSTTVPVTLARCMSYPCVMTLFVPPTTKMLRSRVCNLLPVSHVPAASLSSTLHEFSSSSREVSCKHKRLYTRDATYRTRAESKEQGAGRAGERRAGGSCAAYAAEIVAIRRVLPPSSLSFCSGKPCVVCRRRLPSAVGLF